MFALGCGLALTGVAGLRRRARTGREKVRIVVGLTVAADVRDCGVHVTDFGDSEKNQVARGSA